MKIREIFIISRGTRVVFYITLSVSMLALLTAVIYYRQINSAEDPRIHEARNLLHDSELNASDPVSMVFARLDSAAAIFRSIPDYRNSFETGIIHNNKCSILLLAALYDSTVSQPEKLRLLDISMLYCDSSIMVYEAWIRTWGSLGPDEVRQRINPYMRKEDPSFAGLNYERLLGRRVKSIVEAQTETKRRLSVSLTNKAAIYRHRGHPDSSLVFLNKALGLWSDNRTAQSNLSVLMGGKPVNPSLIESLFPPERIGKD